jgi:hypothetical protein
VLENYHVNKLEEVKILPHVLFNSGLCLWELESQGEIEKRGLSFAGAN